MVVEKTPEVEAEVVGEEEEMVSRLVVIELELG